MFSWIEKIIYKKENTENKLLVGEISQEKKSNRFLLCLFKGILIFIATYCSICGFLDAFEITYSRPVIIFAFAFFAFYVSFLYYSKLIFYLFYIILFILFTVELARYYMPANSGFQAILNIVANKYSDYFALSSVREGFESITNRYLTVTVAALFVGLFTAILLNVTISGYMNAFETALVTFPYIEIALFIHIIPSPVYLFGLLFVYTSVTFLQFSKHSRIQVKGKHTHEFTRYKRKKENLYFYQADILVFLYSFAISAVLSLAIVLILQAPLNTEISKVAGNAIHQKTQEYVKILVQSGYSGFFDRYTSKGGMSSGKLGGVSQIRPDFETDIEATFAPISYETIYLKGFTGSKYTSSEWIDSDYDFRTIENTRDLDFGNLAKMQIKNIDADYRYKYLPYFSHSDDVEYIGEGTDSYEINFKPIISINDYKPVAEDELLMDEDYYYYVYNTCLEVPDELKETLDDTISNFRTFEIDENENINRLRCAYSVYSYFMDNFYYTMAPGSTPSKNDFVEYFLTSQKRGFCVHFASASVLLLREMGVPARYCEGYSIPISLVSDDGVLTENNYDEWYSGNNLLDFNSVINVPVNDSYAHAWIEIYLDGYGFVPFEATIPSFEEENNSRFSLFGFNLFSVLTANTLNLEEQSQNENTSSDGNSGFSISSLFEIFNFNTASVKATVLRIFSAFLTIVLLYFLIRFLIIKIKLAIYRKNNDEYHLVIYEYNKLSAMLRRKGFLKKVNPLPSDVKDAYDLYLAYYNNTHKKKKEVDTKKLFEYYEKVMYS